MSPMSEIPSISSTSTTAQRRKIKKPLIEKRRRLRINQSLANLKSLVLEATQKDENCFPKMEKADILEMTVAYMKTTKHRLPIASGPVAPLGSDDQLRTYLSGFQECAIQVCSFLMDESAAGGAAGGAGADLRGQLTQHLSGCFHRMELDLKTRKDRQQQAAKDRKNQCEDRLRPLTSSSSASSSENNDNRRVTSALSPPVAAAAAAATSSSNYKAEMPRIVGACSAGNPNHFPVVHSSQDSHRDSVASAEMASHPTPRKSNPAVSQTRFVSSAPLKNSSSLIQQQHQHCRSPQRGDDFPLGVATRSSPNSNSVEPMRYALNPIMCHPHRQPIHAVDCNSSAIWRPW